MAKKRRRGRVMSRRVGPIAATWFALGLIIVGAGVVVQSLLLLIAGILSLCIGGAAWTVGDRAGVPAKKATGKTTGKPRKQPVRSGGLAQRCTARCQRSTKPASTCNCACGGGWHGAQVQGTRASLLTHKAKVRDKARAQGRIRNVVEN